MHDRAVGNLPTISKTPSGQIGEAKKRLPSSNHGVIIGSGGETVMARCSLLALGL
jgi:hypothetical protein